MEFKVGDIVYIKGFNECGAIKVVHENFIDKIVRYEVKTNNNEYTLLERMLEPIDINLQHTQNLEQRIEKLEKSVFKPAEMYAKQDEQKPSLLTEDERVVLRNVPKKYKWIARDKIGYLFVHEAKPEKHLFGEDWVNSFDCDGICIFDHLFQFIKWTDKEPYNIEELLKGECGNE